MRLVVVRVASPTTFIGLSSFGRSKLKFPLGVYGRISSSSRICESHRHIILARLSREPCVPVGGQGSREDTHSRCGLWVETCVGLGDMERFPDIEIYRILDICHWQWYQYREVIRSTIIWDYSENEDTPARAIKNYASVSPTTATSKGIIRPPVSPAFLCRLNGPPEYWSFSK